jgi:3-isopropylmalate dehydrogenase
VSVVAVIGGDGIGPEVTAVAVQVLDSLGLDLEFDHLDQVCADRFLANGTTLTDDEFSRLSSAGVILFGAVGDPRVTTADYARAILLRLRADLGLFANVRPALLLADRLSPLRDASCRGLDLILVRENNEGLYAGIGGVLRAGTQAEVAIDEEINSYHGVSQVIDYAFSIARRSVCMVDKSNAVKFGGQLWQRCWRQATARNPQVEHSHLYVDAAAMKLVTDPSSFDVIVTNNSYGDILSDLAAALAGGIGLASSANIHPGTRHGLFEPVHGSAPELVGKELANPVGAILSAAMMLEFLSYPDEAQAVRAAVRRAVASGRCTPDAGGNLTTSGVGRAVIAEVLSSQ